MTKFAAGSNLTGHPLIIFQILTFLDTHPDLSIQAKKEILFHIFRELHGLYREGEHKERIGLLRVKFRGFQDDCISNIDGEREATPIVNTQRNLLDELELDMGDLISDLKILNEAKMGIVTEPSW